MKIEISNKRSESAQALPARCCAGLSDGFAAFGRAA
jgi:hypothetical protein